MEPLHVNTIKSNKCNTIYFSHALCVKMQAEKKNPPFNPICFQFGFKMYANACFTAGRRSSGADMPRT